MLNDPLSLILITSRQITCFIIFENASFITMNDLYLNTIINRSFGFQQNFWKPRCLNCSFNLQPLSKGWELQILQIVTLCPKRFVCFLPLAVLSNVSMKRKCNIYPRLFFPKGLWDFCQLKPNFLQNHMHFMFWGFM